MKNHATLLAVLHIVNGSLGLIVALVVYLAVAGGGWISGDPEAMWITQIVGGFIALFFFVLSVPSIIGGIGLIMMRPWSRVVLMVMGILNLLIVPVGTVLGIYTLWVLMKDETLELLRRRPGRPSDDMLA